MPAGEERKGKANPTPLSSTFSSLNSARCPSGSKALLSPSKPVDNEDRSRDDQTNTEGGEDVDPGRSCKGSFADITQGHEDSDDVDDELGETASRGK